MLSDSRGNICKAIEGNGIGNPLSSSYNTLNMVMYAENIKNRDVTVAMCYGR